MSLLQEMQQHGLADCEYNRTLIGDQTMTYLPDEISISLHFTDIQAIDDSLSNDDARQVLQLMMRREDWFDSETIYSWIQYFKSI
jgi:hypothetical protein